jgi:DNA-binding transcriptional LysR family regulator
MTLDQLRIFGAVAEGEHLTRAARALRMSQGSVSMHVRRLESALGLSLFHRVGRNVRLTDFGQSLRPLVREMMETAESIDDLARRHQLIERGQVSIAAGVVIGAHRLAGWVGPFVQAHPQIEVHVTIASMRDALAALAAGDADIAILGDAVPGKHLQTIALEQTELVIVVAASHPLARVASPLSKLAEYRHLAHEHGSATEIHARRVVSRHAQGAATVEMDEGSLLPALHTGLGFAVMPRAIVEADIAAGRLVVIPRAGGRAKVVFTAVRRAQPHSPSVDHFWRHCAALAMR